MISKVTVKNLGTQTIQSVTIGVIMSESSGTGSKPVVVATRTIPTSIAVGAERELDVFALPMKDARKQVEQFTSSRVRIDTGVFEVEFVNGSKWESDAQKTNKFVVPDSLKSDDVTPARRERRR
jgi:hypothetical protein